MAITLTQNVGARSSGATVLVPFGLANTGGSLLTLHLRMVSGTPVTGVTDSAGNIWAQAAFITNSSAVTSQLFYAPNAIGSTNTVSLPNPDPTAQIQASAQEWSGCSTAAPLVAGTADVKTTVSTHTAGTVTSNLSTTVTIVSYGFLNSFDITAAPSGYTAGISTFATMQMYYKIATSTTTETPQVTSSQTEVTANVIAMFSGAGEFVPTPMVRRRALTVLGVS